MNFYTQQHKHYCGIDLHAKAMYVCILDQSGTILVHKNLPTTPEAFLRLIAPYREDLVVGVECIFTWYWLADLCSKEGIAFVLGHALYMKAIHGGKGGATPLKELIAHLNPVLQGWVQYFRVGNASRAFSEIRD